MDAVIFAWINGLAGRPWLDSLADSIAEDWVFTGILQLTFFWFFWFQEPLRPGRRETLLKGLVGTCAAIVVARVLANILPFRPRPFQLPFMHPISLPHGARFDQASSFPSDTTAYFVAFGTALWFVSRWVGVALVLYAMTVMTLPRIYLGLHYPSDCVAGWLIGVCVPVLVMRGIPSAAATRVISLSERQPGVFYALLFTVAAEMSNAFRDVRATLHGLAWLIRTLRGDHLSRIGIAIAATLTAVPVIGYAVGRLKLRFRRRREGESSPAGRVGKSVTHTSVS